MEDTELLSLDRLPRVSIVILYNGDKTIVDNIIKYNINNTTYPKDRIQLIIGSKHDVQLSLDIKYKVVPFSNERAKLGEMYNKCIEQCKHDYILIKNDDCVYYSNSIYNRIYSLNYKDIHCSFSTNKHYYDITKKKKYYTTEPLDRDYFNRCQPYSLGFKKHFWKNTKFLDDWNTYNDVIFIKDRYDKCIEINSLYVGLSIIHGNNNYTKNLKIYKSEDSKINIDGLEYLDHIKTIYEGDKNNNESDNNESDNNDDKINKEFYSKHGEDTKYTEKIDINDDYVHFTNVESDED